MFSDCNCNTRKIRFNFMTLIAHYIAAQHTVIYNVYRTMNVIYNVKEIHGSSKIYGETKNNTSRFTKNNKMFIQESDKLSFLYK